MQFFNMILVAFAAILIPTEACKCVVGGKADAGVTTGCCNKFNGNVQFGDDCRAGSISEKLRQFQDCCSSVGGRSDCPF